MVTYCSCCEYGRLEIKCPYSLHELGLVEAIKPRTFHVKKYDEEYTLAKNHKYYSHVQHKIYILVNKHCDFVVWISNLHYYVEYGQKRVLNN